MIAKTPKTPYYAVIFSTLRTEVDDDYKESAKKMGELAKHQDGYLGIEAAREGLGITVSYWNSLNAITKWKNNVEHTIIREKGRKFWYKEYKLRICLVERDYGFEK